MFNNIEKIEISKNELMRYLWYRGEAIGMGGYGLILPYSDDTLIKIYYSEIYNTFETLNRDYLEEEIASNKMLKQKYPNKYSFYNRYDELIELIKRLRNAASKDLIKSIVLYEDYAIGILMSWYKGFISLSNIQDKLTNSQKLLILKQIKYLLNSLMENGIYPCDIGDENILIHPKTLEVKLIDLDDELTKIECFESKEFISYAEYDCKKSYMIIKKNLNID